MTLWCAAGRVRSWAVQALCVGITAVAGCHSNPSPPDTSSSTVIERVDRVGDEGSEQEPVAGGEHPPVPVDSGPDESDILCSDAGICAPVLCRISMALEEENSTRHAVSGLCPDGERWSTAGVLIGDRLAWMSPARDELVLYPRRYDGGRDFVLALLAHTDAGEPAAIVIGVQVADTIPQTPLVEVERAQVNGFEYRVYHAPGPDGVVDERYPVLVSIPHGDALLPVEVFLHGFFGEPRMSVEADHITIMPSDPDNTYWWGEAVAGAPQPVTQWRVVDAVAQLVDEIETADHERVVISGASMGGAGAAAIGFTWPDLFAAVVATDGQAVPRNHRQRRIAQLSGLWGPPDDLDPQNITAAWDTTDLTWLLEQNPRARELPVFSRFGRDDGIIHFGALVHRSALTGESWLESMRRHDVALVLGWDEGGHVAVADWLQDRWWTAGWNALSDTVTYVARNTVVLGSRHAQWDGDPGDGQGNGVRDRHPDSAFAGNPGARGDDGWTGQPQGIIGGWVAWMTAGITETPDRLVVPVRLSATAPEPSGQVDIWLHHASLFPRLPTDSMQWAIDGQPGGTVERLDSGALLVRGLRLTTEWQDLELIAARSERR